MNRIRAIVLVLTVPFTLAVQDVSSFDISKLYESTKKLLGAREKVLLITGLSRVVVWKSQLPEEVMVMGMTEVRNNPENVLSSQLAYSVSNQGIFSTSIYQCSWRRVSGNIVYECGVGMRFPPGVRGTVTEDIIRDLGAVVSKGAAVTNMGVTDHAENVVLQPSSP